MNIDSLMNIPLELRELPRWIVWKKVFNPDTEKEQKIPFQPRDPHRRASSTDPLTWSDFRTALFIAENHGFDGIGSVVVDPLIFIDYDRVVEHWTIAPWVFDELKLLNTYSEYSQSGTGIHAVGRAKKPGPMGDEREVYDSGRFMYLTGKLVPGLPAEIRECQRAVDALYEKSTPKTNAPTKRVIINNQGDRMRLVDALDLSIREIAPPDNAVKRGPGVWQGANPWHGSIHGMNYTIDEGRGVWFCFRHWTGGGCLEALAVSEGIINCEDVRSGCLDGHWPEVFDALERRGYRKSWADRAVRVGKKVVTV